MSIRVHRYESSIYFLVVEIVGTQKVPNYCTSFVAHATMIRGASPYRWNISKSLFPKTIAFTYFPGCTVFVFGKGIGGGFGIISHVQTNRMRLQELIQIGIVFGPLHVMCGIGKHQFPTSFFDSIVMSE
jgi:hypothetical protein